MKMIHDIGQTGIDMVLALFHREAWSDITAGLLMALVGGLFVAMRVLMLLLFPLTIPLVMWARASTIPANERR